MRLRTALGWGFLLQALAIVLVYRLPAPTVDTGPRWSWLVLAPGVAWLWDGGVHSAYPLLGLVAGSSLDTLLFGGLLYAIARLTGARRQAAAQ